MLDPVCFHIGDRPFYWYGVFMALGVLAAMAHWHVLGRRENRPPGHASDLAFWLVVAGILGARLAYVVSEADYYLSAPGEILRVDRGGLIYYGGFVGACLALVVLARRRREPLGSLLDFTVTALPLAHALGRVGCFLNSCCYGRVHEGAFAVRYPPAPSGAWAEQVAAGRIGDDALLSLPVMPIQLVEAAGNLVIYGFLLWVYARPHVRGRVAAWYLLLYPVLRFAIEFGRGDPRMTVLGLHVAQLVSLGLLAGGIVLFRRTRHGSRWSPRDANERPAADGGADEDVSSRTG